MPNPVNYYMHRISHEGDVARKLLDDGYLSIGYGLAGDSSDVAFAKTNDPNAYYTFEAELERLFGHRFRSRRVLYRFIAEMSPGDIVLVPGWKSFGVFRVAGAPIARKDFPPEVVATVKDRDIGFVLPVTEVQMGSANVGKEFASDVLVRKFKYPGAGLDLTDIGEEIESALTRFRENKPVVVTDELIGAIAESALQHFRRTITPAQFEDLLRNYFDRLGATDVAIPTKRDKHGLDAKKGDVDVIARFAPLRTVFYVQAKKHDGISGDWAVTQIADFAEGQAERNEGETYAVVKWAITTANEFDANAIEAAEKNGVVLVTGPEFMRMLLQVGVGFARG